MPARPALLLLALTTAAAAVAQETTTEEPCTLTMPGWETAPSATCLAGHADSATAAPQLYGTHAVDVLYESARAGAASRFLRPIQEAELAGALLPDGEVRCVSCHQGDSRWRYRLALPADATGDEPTPLCRRCHATGD